MQQDAIQAVRTLTLGRPYVAGAANTCCKPPAQSWFLRVLLTGSYGFLRVLTGSYGFLRVLGRKCCLIPGRAGRQVLGCNCERQARRARSWPSWVPFEGSAGFATVSHRSAGSRWGRRGENIPFFASSGPLPSLPLKTGHHSMARKMQLSLPLCRAFFVDT